MKGTFTSELVEPLGTWCKVSGGCFKPPRSFIGRTPTLSGCWRKTNQPTTDPQHMFKPTSNLFPQSAGDKAPEVVLKERLAQDAAATKHTKRKKKKPKTNHPQKDQTSIFSQGAGVTAPRSYSASETRSKRSEAEPKRPAKGKQKTPNKNKNPPYRRKKRFPPLLQDHRVKE